jgi:hypothetical protein
MNFTFVASLSFEAEDEDDAYAKLEEYLMREGGMNDPDRWALDETASDTEDYLDGINDNDVLKYLREITE